MKSNTKALLTIALFSLVISNVTGQQHGSECVADSDCNEEANLHCLGNKCECIEGHTSNRDGICRKSYNVECAHLIECNLDRQLTCDYNISLCKCQKPEEQIFDDGPRRACVSLIGYYCAHQSTEFSLNCVEGAYCDMPIINGSMTHKCECNPEWEPTDEKKCKEIVFGNDLVGSECTANGDCDERANLFCSENICQCVSGHIPTRRKTCKKTFGEDCGTNLECNEDRFLKCTDVQPDLSTKCECAKPTEQIYEAGTTNACVSLQGHECSMETGEFFLKCVNGAYCDMPIVNGTMLHKCECRPGWQETEQGTCQEIVYEDGLHNSSCTTTADCNERENLFCSGNRCECKAGHTPTRSKTCKKTFGEDCGTNLECNEDRFLKCTDVQPDLSTKCECAKPTEQIYEAGTTNACVSLQGHECSMETGEFFLKCVNGAYCDMPIVNGTMLHKCECRPGWEKTEQGTCQEIVYGDGLHNSSCTTTADCNERENLFCSGNRCECKEGHTPTRSKTCRRSFGEDCNEIDVCNGDRFLTCGDTSGKCQCLKPEEQTYDNGTKNACVSLVGFECSMEAGEYFLKCVEGGFCDMPIVDGIMLHKCKCDVGWGQTANLTCEETGTTDSGHSMSMSMSFHTGTDETVLFDFWKTKETGAFIGSLIVIFLMAFGYEALKFVRELLYEHAVKQIKHSTASTRLLVGSASIWKTIFSTWHITQTFLHMFQFVLSYFLMLIFMTYNVWLGLAITLGGGLGFYCFGWKKTTVFNSNDHCQ